MCKYINSFEVKKTSIIISLFNYFMALVLPRVINLFYPSSSLIKVGGGS